jgi:DNA repair exonuclease SbcCD ATPase subunit
MTMSEQDLVREHHKIALPQPRRAVLRNFSLYNNRPVITAEFGEGVFCLAGANGLGKSTFLASLNFAITGIVVDPSRKFDSVDEYYKYSIGYSTDYFRGRISERDRDAAEIELEMLVGRRHYRLVRSMFEPDGLRELTISDGPIGVLDAGLNSVTVNNRERQEFYRTNIVSDAGLESFEQLVFLQHYVMTFDERRHLLFWDKDVAQSALFMAFGLSLETAERADNLRRTAERADSLVRNLQWQATEVRRRLQDLEAKSARADAQAEPSVSVDVGREHQSLLEEQQAVVAKLIRLEAEIKDTELRAAEMTAQRHAARMEYDQLFRRRMATPTTPPAGHPVVALSIDAQECAVCGTHGEAVSTAIQGRLAADSCPLCGSSLAALTQAEDPAALEALRALDTRMASYDAGIRDGTATARRLAVEAEQLRVNLRSVAEKLGAFERENELVLATGGHEGAAIRGVTDQYRQQIADLMERKQKETNRRTAARTELRALQAQLAEAYSQVQDEFVPRFNELANEFLGLDLDVSMEIQSSGVQLVLSVDDTRRRAQDTLSESQRLFVDIALRMALVQQMSPADHSAGLYIDTPEGSLDIAYESRAGRMFGSFVQAGHQLIMTANINTSQLLRKLAETCGPTRMALLRMTDWTSLSEVQIAEENLFDDAFAAIEQALAAGG